MYYSLHTTETAEHTGDVKYGQTQKRQTWYDWKKETIIKNNNCIIRRSGESKQEKSKVRKKIIKCFYDSYAWKTRCRVFIKIISIRM